ncbi:MAG: hypothetical protein JST22_04355 [Bacteroidetes bacterium]|nr:hypothetical protein [Bacteroidota bacterium]
MKLLTACCLSALLFAGSAAMAQTSSGSMTKIGTITVNTTVVTYDANATARKQSVGNEVGVFRTSGGQVVYGMTASTISVVAGDASIDNVSTSDILNAVSAEAVRQGNALGYTAGTTQTAVWCESYVARNGSGTNTSFSVYSPDDQTGRQFYLSNGSTVYTGSTTTSTQQSSSSVY